MLNRLVERAVYTGNMNWVLQTVTPKVEYGDMAYLIELTEDINRPVTGLRMRLSSRSSELIYVMRHNSSDELISFIDSYFTEVEMSTYADTLTTINLAGHNVRLLLNVVRSSGDRLLISHVGSIC